MAIGIAVIPARSHAQWWSSREPSDFEDCAEKAEKAAASKEAKTSLLAQCDSRFAGRRKTGGGYTYFDFMQNRNFDIAGPNPTAEELKKMDEQYTDFLDRRRRSSIAAAFAEKQRQQQTQAALGQDSGTTQLRSTEKPQTTSDKPRARPRSTACRDDSFSCGWSRFRVGLNVIKKTLLGPPARKSSRGRLQT